MANIDGLRSGYAKVGALVFFGRMLDKIRLADQLGLQHRTDVQTFFDLYDADEGRDIPSGCI